MNVRYVVTLSPQERSTLQGLVRGGSRQVRRIKRAQSLLAANGGATDEQIATSVSVGTSTVFRTRRRFVEEGLDAALSEEPRPGGERKLSPKEEALLVAVACSAPPKGCARWTLELLAGRLIQLTCHKRLSRETVRRRLAEKELKPWQKKMCASRRSTPNTWREWRTFWTCTPSLRIDGRANKG
jgi:transposase